MAEPTLPPLSHYAKATLTVVAVLAIVAALWAVRNIVVLVLVAAVLAVGLDPAVRQLQRLHISRGWAVVIIFTATIGFIVLFGLLVIPPLVREVRDLAANIPGYIDRLQKSNHFVAQLQTKYHLSERLKSLTDKLPSIASTSIGTILGITKSIAAIVFNLLTIAILTIYFLMSLPRTEQLVQALFRGQHRQRDVQTFETALKRIGGYVSGNIAVSIIAGVAAYVALRIIGVPFAVALAMWVAVADLIPSVGATLGAIAAVIVAAFSSWGDAVATLAYFIVYQQIENYVIVPRVMRQAIDLSPAVVIVSVLAVGSLAGFAGALLALPLAAAAKVVITELWLRERVADVEAPSSTPPLERLEEPAPGL